MNIKQTNGFIEVNHRGETNVPGIYAAGDCICYPYSLEQLATATSSAIYAVAAIYEYLKGKRPPIVWGESRTPRT